MYSSDGSVRGGCEGRGQRSARTVGHDRNFAGGGKKRKRKPVSERF
jgi:hypothetical protein